MSIVSSSRATYQQIDGNLKCGKSDNQPQTPTTTETTEHHYVVNACGKRFVKRDIHGVNQVLAAHPTAKVVRVTKTTTVRTSFKRIR